MAQFEGTNATITLDGSSVPKKRTLMIGVGGSGKEVLFRFRRKLVEINDGFVQHPYIEYLWIDTDTRNTNIHNVNFDRSFDMAKLQDNEKLGINLTVKQLQTFYDTFNAQQNYHSWFNIDDLKGMGAQVLMQGASAMRPFGKLAFWYNVTDIKASIQAKINRLKSPNFNVPNLSPASDIEVYVIGSLAGGTGSGMFIDISALLQSIDANLKPVGIFFLADIFKNASGNHNEREANCYAALQELDFYMTPENIALKGRNPHLFSYDWGQGLTHHLNLPIYPKLNLISNEYENAQIESDMDEAFNLVAEYLILGYNDSSFDGDVRSTRTNVIKGYNNILFYKNVLSNGQEISQPFPTTYTGLGLGMIEFNKRKIQNWAKYKFLEQFCEDVLNKGESDSTLYEDQSGNIEIELLDPGKLWNALERGKDSTSPIDKISSKVNIEVNAMIDEFLNDPVVKSGDFNKIEALKSKIQNRIVEYFDKQKSYIEDITTHDASHTGEVYQDLEHSYKKTMLSLKEQVKQKFYKIISYYRANGYQTAQDYLEKLRGNTITKLINYAAPKASGSFSYKTPDALVLPGAEGIQEWQKYATDSAKIPALFIGYRSAAVDYYQNLVDRELDKYTGSLRQAIKEYAQRHEEQLKLLLKHRCEKIIKGYYQSIVDDVKAQTDETKQKPLGSVKENLSGWKEAFSESKEAYKIRQGTGARRKLTLDNYLVGKLNASYDDFTKEFSHNGYMYFMDRVVGMIPDSVKSLLAEEGLGGQNEMLFAFSVSNYNRLLNECQVDLKKLIEKAAGMVFSSYLQNMTVNSELLELLNDNSLRNGLEQDIRKVEEQSCMRLGFRADNFIRQNRKLETLIVNGMQQNTALKNQLETIMGKNLDFQATNDSFNENIVFYVEGSGFPVAGLSSLVSMRTAFMQDVAANNANIYKRYTTKNYEYLRDLVCMQDAEFESYIEKYAIAIMAILQGLISYDKIDAKFGKFEHRFRYQYREKGVNKTVDLQKQIESIALLLDNPGFDDVVAMLKGQSDLFEQDTQYLIKLMGAVIKNHQNLLSERIGLGQKRTTPGAWAMESVKEKLDAVIRQKMRSEYSSQQELDDYMANHVYEGSYPDGDYELIPYVTSEYKYGLYVMKKN
ncbi:MAG: tubulin-like doman-containing protein [Candidatus Cloacimonetes bacterium]|nr:tubulin-like doman-containing protein [Candidatus Cloacimonadota bacterium]